MGTLSESGHNMEWSVKRPKGSVLAEYADEPDDESQDSQEYPVMILWKCSCGGSKWLPLGSDVEALCREHVRVANAIHF